MLFFLESPSVFGVPCIKTGLSFLEFRFQAKPAIDYSDLLNQKRKQEKEHRNSADIFAGPLKSSTSDGYLAGLPNYNDPGGGGDQSLAAGLSDLSKVVRNGLQSGFLSFFSALLKPPFVLFLQLDRMKQNLSDPLTSRQTWSAPNGDPLSHNSRMSSRNGFTLESPFDKPRGTIHASNQGFFLQ